MHKVALNPAVVEKVIARRGRRHSFSDLNPRRTALLVIDMQNAWCEPGFSPSHNQHVLDIVPNINRIAAALRSAGGLVAWVSFAADEASLKTWSVRNQRMMTPAARDERLAWCKPGSHGYALWRELDVQPGDIKVDKTRYSALIHGSSTLEPLLRQRGVDTVIVTGTATGTCCESTARDAMMLNFAAIMVGDALADGGDDAHNAALTGFYRNFGDVMSTDEVIGFIATNAKA
jgi:ureidoacrylate peracid hydrolase